MPGRRLIQISIAGTVLFTLVSVLEVILMGWTRPVAVAIDLGLFAVGCTAFLAAYAIAIGRSRTEEIGVASLYLLTNKVAPNPVRLRLLGAFGVQCVVAITAASVRPFTTAAFSVLVPMFGLGLNGVWAARHGTFAPRRVHPVPSDPVPGVDADAHADGEVEVDDRPDAQVDATSADGGDGGSDAPADTEIGQNAGHG